MSRYAIWIALRYLHSRRVAQFTSIIGAFSVLGIIIGVAAVICVASIFLGFRQLFENLMLRVDPHIRITSLHGKYVPYADSLLSLLSRLGEGVVVPLHDGKAVAMHRTAMHILLLRGIDSSAFQYLSRMRECLIVGSLPTNRNEIVISAGAAERLNAVPGDTIWLISPEYLYQAAVGFTFPSSLPLHVCGIILTNDRNYDNILAITYRTTAQQLFEHQDLSPTAVDFYAVTTEAAEVLLHLLRNNANELGEHYTILTWKDLHRPMYAVMEWERVASFLLLSLIVLIAVFNIVAQLTIVVTSKQRDIAILRTLGATSKFVGYVFRLQGLFIGIMGTVVGATVGFGLCLGQQYFHWIMLNTDQYIMQELPIAIDWRAAIAVVVISISSSLLASIAPARRAMSVPIASSLRFE